MKMLVIGIDGADEHLVRTVDMPFVRRLLETGSPRTLTEDLFSRGWGEILTGLHGSETRGLYQWPKLDGSYDFTPRFSASTPDLLEAGVEPLWKRLNDCGISVGIQNVPATYPAPTVDGFFVSGGGGGLFKVEGVSPQMTYPASINAMLNDRKFIPDVNLRAPALYGHLSAYLPLVERAVTTHVDSFLALSHEFRPDFGFICFKLSVELLFLAMVEIEALASGSPADGSPVTDAINGHFLSLDRAIERLFDKLEPEHYMVVADHGTVPFRYDANIDPFLAAGGWLTMKSTAHLYAIKAKNRIRAKYNRARKKLGMSVKYRMRSRPYTEFDPRKTSAFGTFFDSGNMAGIYINDRERFDGPIRDRRSLEAARDDICAAINADPTFSEYGVAANLYRAEHEGARFERYLPDIRLEKPDHIFFSGRRRETIAENSNYRRLSDDISRGHYPHTGLKGRNPLFVVDAATARQVNSDDPDDLRIAYRLIDRTFS